MFAISKGQFKRALGSLMKQGKIKQENGKTYLIKNNLQRKTIASASFFS